MNFDEFWVRVDLVKFDIQDRNKQRVLVYFRALSVHIHIARVLRPAPCSMPLRSALLSSNCAKIGIRNANVFPEPGSEMVRDGQRWSEAGSAKSKANPMQRGYFHQIIHLFLVNCGCLFFCLSLRCRSNLDLPQHNNRQTDRLLRHRYMNVPFARVAKQGVKWEKWRQV